MDPARLGVLLAAGFLLTFGLLAYRVFFPLLGAAAGLAAAATLQGTLAEWPVAARHPALASALLFLVLAAVGALLAVLLRRALAFMAGAAAGLSAYLAVLAARSGSPPDLELLSGGALWAGAAASALGGGLLVLLLERVFALLVTAVAGAALGAWVLGGPWAFWVLLAVGLVVQPVLSLLLRGRRTGKGDGPAGAAAGILLVLSASLAPAPLQAAALAVERVTPSANRVLLTGGHRQGVRLGEVYAVVDEGRRQAATVKVSEVFTDSAYAEALSPEGMGSVRPGYRVVLLEDFEFEGLSAQSGEARLERYLERYPSGRRRPEVERMLDDERFRRALSQGTSSALRDFRARHPQSRHLEEARRGEEDLGFSEARRKGTEEAFLEFLKAHPGSSSLSGIEEFRDFEAARRAGRIAGYQEFLARYPSSVLGREFRAPIEEFQRWADELALGKDREEAMRRLAATRDEAAVPLLVGKLLDPQLASLARASLAGMGPPAVGVLMEVLISPLQEVALKDEVALLLARTGDYTAVPALRSYVRDKGTDAGRRALKALEERVAR